MENNDNANYLFDLIQGLQTKLNDEKSKSTNDYVQESFFNESKKEEAVHNNSKKEENSNKNSEFNISELLNNFNLSGLFGSNNEENNSGFDINTVMKIQKVLSSMNKEDPRKNLLLSLKPFLRKSRQDKINEYLTCLSIGTALGIFDDKGSDKNDA
ncbi:MAG: hypothetical protein RR290_02525 [Clostridia bacterium]